MKILTTFALAASLCGILDLKAFAASVDLSWTAVAQNPAGTLYNVYRAPGTCGGTQQFTKQNLTPVSASTFRDTGIVNGNSYCYYTTATVGAQESAPSNKATASIPLGAPTGLTINVTFAGTITLDDTQLAKLAEALKQP